MSLQNEISRSCNEARVGRTEEVIVDSFTDGVLVCRSRYESPEVDGEILVGTASPLLEGVDPYCLVGEIITVTITGADDYDLCAEIISL